MLRSVLSAVALAVLMIGANATSASAAVAPVSVSLNLPGFGDMALDEAHGKLFVSSGVPGNSVVVVNTLTAGALPTTVNNLPGASGMTLSADGTRLFVALATGDAVAVLDTSTNAEVARYATGPQTCPSDLTHTASLVWFSYGCPGALAGKIGVIDPSKPAAGAVGFDAQGSVKFTRAPLLASPPVGGFIVAAQPATSLSNVVVFPYLTTDPVTGARTLGASVADNVGGGGLADLTVSPDTKTLFTASGSRDRAEAFATADLSGRGAYSARPRPDAVAINPAGTYLAVGAVTPDNNDILIYQPGASAPTTTQTLAPGDVVAPRGLAFGGSTLNPVYAIVLHDGQPQPSLVTINAATTA